MIIIITMPTLMMDNHYVRESQVHHWRKNQGGWGGGQLPPSLKSRGAEPPLVFRLLYKPGVGLTLWFVLALH